MAENIAVGQFILPKNKQKKSKIKKAQARWGIAFLTPSLLFFAVFTIIPLALAIYISFIDYRFDELNADFIGFGNFKAIFIDFSNFFTANDSLKLFFANIQEFFKLFDKNAYAHSIINIFVYAAMSVPLSIISALMIANLLNQKLKGTKLYRVLYYLPAVTSGIAVAFVWKWILNQRFGLFNTMLGTNIDWMGAPTPKYLPMFSIVLITTWGGIGGSMLIYLAGLKGISPELYEAAEVDGAHFFQKLRYITIPLLRPTTYFILTMSLIGSFQLYDVIAMIASGNHYVQTPMIFIYNNIGRLRGGQASAMSLVLFIVIMIVTFITQKFTKETY